jgi:hypothetical protein
MEVQMNGNRPALALGFAFVIGCVAGPMAQQAVARAYAQPGPTKRWEQFCSYRKSAYASNEATLIADANADLKAKGAEGWELASGSFDNGNLVSYCFKRPVP